MILVSRLITYAAIIRNESRGTHFRNDYLETNKDFDHSNVFTAEEMNNYLLKKYLKGNKKYSSEDRIRRIVYLNGDFLNENDAKVSIFDRGFLMADGVYEVTSVINGKLIDFDGHAIRLQRSMSELMMESAISKEDLLEVHRQLIIKNDLNEGMIYLQVSRGIAERDFAFPSSDTPLTITAFTQKKKLINNSR